MRATAARPSRPAVLPRHGAAYPGGSFGKDPQPLPSGAELYGHAGCASDLEVIRLMLEMFS